MKKLTEDEIVKCKALGEEAAEKNVDSIIEHENRERKVSSQEVVSAIFDDWNAFAQWATDILVESGLIGKPSDHHNGHEKLLAFKLLTDAYHRKITALIIDRYKVFLQVPFREKDAVKALGAKWDANTKKWYVPEGLDVGPFAQWVETSYVAPAIAC
jgi:hypothetical protein